MMDGFVHSLKYIPEECWLMPISDGKWSPAEIIAHLVEWYWFLLTGGWISLNPAKRCRPHRSMWTG
jgi:hypothetical protein